ncbi:MAG TPA: glycosyltransferase family 2 protein [Candidatus Omnitrophota bacterium]|nr:glycosyltransferase family 2 protein [Candidatus Omnitrophota bacterium]HPT39229.1 glycosyltransferase family 2 protein [Candidatus Omnitrophota bacterium]
MKVSVIIVTIGAKDYLKACLNSLFAQSYLPAEIIVVDNSLKTGLRQEIERLYPPVHVFSADKNLFYAGGMNQGILLSRGKFVLCLNDDTVLDKNFIFEALKGFTAAGDIGMVSGKFLRGDKKTLDSTGLVLSLWRTAKERGYGRLDSGQFEKSGFIFGVSGAAAFYRREMLEKIKSRGGYFDSRFRMFYEDLDLCWRANRAGWRGYYVPRAIIYHVRGGSFRPDSGIDKPLARRYLNDQLQSDLIKNRYFTILKNEKFLSLFLHLIPIMIYDLCVWSYILFFHPKVIKILFKQSSLAAGSNFQDSKQAQDDHQ